ncbi:unnamed protein product [Bathycoccus prasinos]
MLGYYRSTYECALCKTYEGTNLSKTSLSTFAKYDKVSKYATNLRTSSGYEYVRSKFPWAMFLRVLTILPPGFGGLTFAYFESLSSLLFMAIAAILDLISRPTEAMCCVSVSVPLNCAHKLAMPTMMADTSYLKRLLPLTSLAIRIFNSSEYSTFGKTYFSRNTKRTSATLIFCASDSSIFTYVCNKGVWNPILFNLSLSSS